MKKTITVTETKEVDVKTLHVEAGVRYWEDSTINGESDTESGSNIPCKSCNMWKPIIDLETGKILNWEQGKTAEIHYKICDSGSYYVKDVDGNIVLTIENDYVPSLLCPKEDGYGDYIIMDVDADGMIQDWECDLSSFADEDYNYNQSNTNHKR